MPQNIKEWLKVKHREFYILSFIALFSIFYEMLWYRYPVLTFGGDFVFIFHPGKELHRMIYAYDWWGDIGTNAIGTRGGAIFLDIIILYFLKDLGHFSDYLSNFIWLYLRLVVLALSVYVLAISIGKYLKFDKNEMSLRVFGVIAIILYFFTPLMFSDTYKSIVGFSSFANSFYLLFLGMIFRGLTERKYKYALPTGIFTYFALSAGYVNAYQKAILTLLLLCVVSAFLILESKGRKKRLLFIFRFFGLVVLTSLIVNLYWLIPSLCTQFTFYAHITKVHKINTFFSKWSVMINVLRLLNPWGFWAGHYVPYSKDYLKPPLSVISFLWPIIVFMGLITIGKDKKSLLRALSLYFLFIIAIFGAKTYNEPFGGVYYKIVTLHVMGFYPFKAFYTPGAVTESLLSWLYPILGALFLTKLISSILKRESPLSISKDKRRLFHKVKPIDAFKRSLKKSEILRLALLMILIGVIIYNARPIISGEVLENWYSISKFHKVSYGIVVPKSYYIVDSLTKNSKFYERMLLLPRPMIYVGTSWYLQSSSVFYNRFFKIPVITTNYIPYQQKFGNIGESLRKLYVLPLTFTNNRTHMLNELPTNTYRIAPLATLVQGNVESCKMWHAIGKIKVEGNAILMSIIKVENSSAYLEGGIKLKHFVDLSSYQLLMFNVKISSSLLNTTVSIGIRGGNMVACWQIFNPHCDYKTEVLLPLSIPDRGKVDLSKVASIWVEVRNIHQNETPGNIEIRNITFLSISQNLLLLDLNGEWKSWEGDHIYVNKGWVKIDFNPSSYVNKWHEVCLKLPNIENWSPYNYLRIALKVNGTIQGIEVGIGSKGGLVGWWIINKYISPYESRGSSIVVYIPIERPQFSKFNIKKVSSIWFKYYVKRGVGSAPKLVIYNLTAGKAIVNDAEYAKTLARYDIKYVLIDKSIVVGKYGDYKEYLFMRSSSYFKRIYCDKYLELYINTAYNNTYGPIMVNGTAYYVKIAKITPVQIELYVNSNRPFNLILSAGYSPYWTCEVYKKAHHICNIHPVFDDGMMKFFINQTGPLRVLITYPLQSTYQLLFRASMLALFALILGYAILPMHRRRSQ